MLHRDGEKAEDTDVFCTNLVQGLADPDLHSGPVNERLTGAGEEFSLTQSFVPFRPSPDQMRPTHAMKSKVLSQNPSI